MHEPHCSEYGKLCLQRYGFFRSIGKITSRVFSCTGGMHKIYDPEFYKVVFFSSAPIGVPFLEKLYADKRFEVTGVVTMPDAPSGRGMKMQENIIKTKTKELFATQGDCRMAPYTSLYKKDVCSLFHTCFSNDTYGKQYNYDYYYTQID